MVGYVESKGTADEVNYDLGILETKSGAADFCTKVDVENEHMIMEGIRQRFPSHDIIGEETTGTGPVPALRTDVPTWIIDPIDGTTNFSSGLSMTCVSIGFCVNGRPVMGVIYAPITEEWYLAVKGHGAYRNGVPITQRADDSKKSLQTAVVCCEFGYSRKQDEIDAMLGAVSKILAKGCRGIRQLGSGCLDLCYVATGRLDVVYAGIVNEGWKPWDYAAGLVICQEAGCIMESIDQKAGEDFDLYSKSILCGVSRELVDECRALLTSNL
jgi:fructose-1,6-bisphosphatase/inositol monophosphatase family enzyme